MSDRLDLAGLLADPAAVDRLAPAEVPPLLGALVVLAERLKLRLLVPGPPSVSPVASRVLSVSEVAERLGVNPREVRRLFARPAPHGLPHVELGPKTKGVLEDDFAAFLARQRHEPPPARRGRGVSQGPLTRA